MQTWDVVGGLHNFQEFSKPPECRWGSVNTEKMLYCSYKMILKNMRRSKMSQPCLHTFFLYLFLLFFFYNNNSSLQYMIKNFSWSSKNVCKLTLSALTKHERFSVADSQKWAFNQHVSCLACEMAGYTCVWPQNYVVNQGFEAKSFPFLRPTISAGRDGVCRKGSNLFGVILIPSHPSSFLFHCNHIW